MSISPVQSARCYAASSIRATTSFSASLASQTTSNAVILILYLPTGLDSTIDRFWGYFFATIYSRLLGGDTELGHSTAP